MKQIPCLFANPCLCLLATCIETQIQTAENSIDLFAMNIQTNNTTALFIIGVIIIRDTDEFYYSEDLNVLLGEKYES